MGALTHYYAWKNDPPNYPAEWPVKRPGLYRRPCRVLRRGAKGSVLIEFADGQREVVSRYAVRRLTA